MPVSYQFDGRVAIVKMEREYSLDALMEFLRACLADPRCPAQPAVLLDASAGYVPFGLTSAKLHALGRLLAYLGTERCGPIALVAGSQVTFELLRSCAAHAEGTGATLAVFRSSAAAAEWLALPAAPAAAGAVSGSAPAGALAALLQ